MHLSFHPVPLVLLCVSRGLADFLGPSYPTPVDLSSSKSLVAASWKNLTLTLQNYINDGDQNLSSGVMAEIKNVTFSLGMFSLNVLLQ
jgi:hypothetical protein